MIVAAFEFGSVRVDQFRSLALKHAVARAQRQSIAHLDLHIEKESTIQIVFKMGGSVRIWRLRYVLVKCQGHTHHDAYVNIESSVFFSTSIYNFVQMFDCGRNERLGSADVVLMCR